MCTFCSGPCRKRVHEDIEGDRYCSKACRRDHILLSISRALFLIAGKECCDD